MLGHLYVLAREGTLSSISKHAQNWYFLASFVEDKKMVSMIRCTGTQCWTAVGRRTVNFMSHDCIVGRFPFFKISNEVTMFKVLSTSPCPYQRRAYTCLI